jgi:hypothetical protein
MKNSKLLLALSILLFSAAARAQADTDVLTWYFSLAQGTPKLNAENQLVISVDIKPGYILYASGFSEKSVGPIPTQIRFSAKDGFQVAEPLRSIHPQAIQDEGFGLAYQFFSEQAEFRQCFFLNRPNIVLRGAIVGKYVHQASGKEFPFEKSFELPLSNAQ